LSISAYAQNPVDRREDHQRDRIKQGIKNGELTKAEARHLRVEEARIRLIEAKAKSDGQITTKEARQLDRRLDKTSRHIYRQKHDRQDRN
jgi:hypothetical protein